MDAARLRDRITGLPKRPGAYIFKGAGGDALYVGKARSLRQRVQSYFQPSAKLSQRTRVFVPLVADIEYFEAPSEAEALLLEARLVREIRPKYNVNLKDDKSFPFLGISTDDDYAQVFVTRERTEDTASERAGLRGIGTFPSTGRLRSADRYGPFPDAGALRQAVLALQEVFRFRTCNLVLRTEAAVRRGFRPCLLYHIDRCSAPCAGRLSPAAYAIDIASLREFLERGSAPVLAALEARMKAAAQELAYEHAAEFRDQIQAIENLNRLRRPAPRETVGLLPLDPREGVEDLVHRLGLDPRPRRIEGIDLANLAGHAAVGSVVTFDDGVPHRAGYRRFRIQGAKQRDDYEMMREIVRRRMSRLAREGAPAPDLLLLDGGPGHLSAVAATLRELPLRPTHLLALAKRDGDHLFRLSAGGPRIVRMDSGAPGLRLLQFVRDEAHRFARRYHHFLRRRSVLGPRSVRGRTGPPAGRES